MKEMHDPISYPCQTLIPPALLTVWLISSAPYISIADSRLTQVSFQHLGDNGSIGESHRLEGFGVLLRQTLLD